MKIRSFLLLILFYMPIFMCIGQERIDVIYLKNGDILKGIIIENIPDKHVRIELKDGSLFTIKYQDIVKFTREKIEPSGPSASQQSGTTGSISQLNTNQMMYYESEKKSNSTAVLLSILLTSSGHAYAGNWLRGLIFTAARAGGVVLALTAGMETYYSSYGSPVYNYYGTLQYYSYSYEPYTELTAWFYVGLGISLVAAVWEAIDASSQVDKYNDDLYKKLLGKKPYGLDILPGKDGAQLRFTYNFP